MTRSGANAEPQLGAVVEGDERFGISESTAHAYTSTVIHLLAERAPGLLFTAKGAQGGAPGEELDPLAEQMLSGLLEAMVDELAEQFPPDTGTRDARLIESPGPCGRLSRSRRGASSSGAAPPRHTRAR